MVAPDGKIGPDTSVLEPISDKACDPPGGCVDCLRASALGVGLAEEEVRTLFDVVDVREHSVRPGNPT